jgi:hypothetical protein
MEPGSLLRLHQIARLALKSGGEADDVRGSWLTYATFEKAERLTVDAG